MSVSNILDSMDASSNEQIVENGVVLRDELEQIGVNTYDYDFEHGIGTIENFNYGNTQDLQHVLTKVQIPELDKGEFDALDSSEKIRYQADLQAKKDRLSELTRASEFISTSCFGDKCSDGSCCTGSSSRGGII